MKKTGSTESADTQQSREALPSFSKEIFRGNILENAVFPFPEINTQERETLRMILDSISKFRSTVDARVFDEEGAFPTGYVKNLGELGVMGLAVPEEFGGLGLSNRGYVRVMEEIAGFDGSTAVTLGAHQSIGFKALTLFGSSEQKEKYYPALASGEKLACFALTEPGSGSDAGSIKTKAVLSSDGKNFIINGEKLWITNADIAQFMTLFAKTDEIDKVTGQPCEKVTAFIVDLPAQGVTFGPPENKMGIRASRTVAVHFDNLVVPVENVLGGRGRGFKVAMEVLNNGRLGLAGGCVGGCKTSIKIALRHASQRKQFGKNLSDFGMIKSKLGRMITDTYVAESMVYMTTSLIDEKQYDYSMESAIAKIYSSEAAWRVSNEAIQILGGMGYMKECEIERIARDARINMIFEGANEVLRLFVALSGLQGPGQELAEVLKAIKEPLRKIGLLTEFAAKTIKLNVVGTSLSKTHPSLKKEAGLFEDYVAEFALQCQKLLQRHGKSISEKQFACKRVANIAIDLFGMSCVLSRVTKVLETPGMDAEMDLAVARSFFTQANRRLRGNFKAIDRNDDDELKALVAKHVEVGEFAWDLAIDPK